MKNKYNDIYFIEHTYTRNYAKREQRYSSFAIETSSMKYRSYTVKIHISW